MWHVTCVCARLCSKKPEMFSETSKQRPVKDQPAHTQRGLNGSNTKPDGIDSDTIQESDQKKRKKRNDRRRMERNWKPESDIKVADADTSERKTKKTRKEEKTREKTKDTKTKNFIIRLREKRRRRAGPWRAGIEERTHGRKWPAALWTQNDKIRIKLKRKSPVTGENRERERDRHTHTHTHEPCRMCVLLLSKWRTKDANTKLMKESVTDFKRT